MLYTTSHLRMHQHTLTNARSYEGSPRAVERVVVHVADAPRVYAPGIYPDDKGPSFKVFNALSLVDGPICPRYLGRKSRETYRRPAAFALWNERLERKRASYPRTTNLSAKLLYKILLKSPGEIKR